MVRTYTDKYYVAGEVGAYMSVNTCISVNAAGVGGITAEQPVGQKISTASQRKSEKGTKAFKDCIAEMGILPGENNVGGLNKEETAADTVTAETISSTIFLSNLFFFKPLNSANTASGTGVRLDIPVSTGVQPGGIQPDVQNVYIVPNINTGSQQELQQWHTGDEAIGPETVKPEVINNTFQSDKIEKSDIPAAGLYINKTEAETKAAANIEVIKPEEQSAAQLTDKVVAAELTPKADSSAVHEEQVTTAIEIKTSDKEQSKKGKEAVKSPESGGKTVNRQTASDIILGNIEGMRNGNSKPDMNLQDSSEQTIKMPKIDRDENKPEKNDNSFINVNQFAELSSPVTDNNGSEAIEKSSAVEKAFVNFNTDLRTVETGEHEIKIVLEPESYGEIAITVKRNDEGISAKIKSEDREVCAAVTKHLQKLINSIESKGVTVNNVDVIFNQAEGSMDFSQSFSSGSGAQQRGYSYQQTFRAESTENSAFFDQWQHITSVNAETAHNLDSGHTVEYRI